MWLFEDALREIVEAVEGWEVEDSSTLICPDGDPIELDGVCPHGHASPLLALGMI